MIDQLPVGVVQLDEDQRNIAFCNQWIKSRFSGGDLIFTLNKQSPDKSFKHMGNCYSISYKMMSV